MAEHTRTSARLWHRPDFVKLWTGQSVSILGSQITLLALPLTAVLILRTNALQMGLLAAAGSAPWLLIGLVAGVWVDRLPRRRILLFCDLGRAVMLGSVPVAAWLHLLSLTHLYVVAFLSGTLTVFFDVAYQSFVPALVEREDLVAGNSTLEVSASTARIIGPGAAGGLVQALSAPSAILVDAISFLVSVLFLALIHTPGVPSKRQDQRHSMWREMRDGVRLVWSHPLLRSLTLGATIFNLFDHMLLAVYVLYMVHTIGLTPALVGAVFTLGSVGNLMAAVLVGPLGQRVGLGHVLVGGLVLGSIAELTIALAGGPPLTATLIVAAGEAAVQCGTFIYAITAMSVRQALVADRVVGRVNGTVRVLTWGMGPIGAIVGGILAQGYGLRVAVAAAAIGTFLAFPAVLFSPAWSLKDMSGLAVTARAPQAPA